MFEKDAEEYYYKNYPVTLNIGEEERKKKVTDMFITCAEFGYNKACEWHYCKDKLPPEPEEKEGSIKPLYYICAYQVMADYETDFFMYVGNGEFLGNSEHFPIYAWLDCPVNVPEPPKESK